MLKIYIADTKGLQIKNYPFFSSYRKEKLNRIKNEERLRQGVAAEMLLCFAAQAEGLPLPLEIKTLKKGKPYTEGINFSISHSREKVLLALSDEEVGADIQKINPSQNLYAAKKFLTADESQGLDINSFFKFFTMKESYFKMTGEGLPFSPVPFSSFQKCCFKVFTEGDYMISVCSPSEFDAAPEFIDLNKIKIL